MKLNRGGLIFCAVYFCWLAALSGLAFLAADPKGGWFVDQLSILPCLVLFILLAALGLGAFLEHLFIHSPLLNSGLFTVPVSFVLVYLTGWAVSAFAKKMKSVKPDPSMPVVDPPSWSDRR